MQAAIGRVESEHGDVPGTDSAARPCLIAEGVAHCVRDGCPITLAAGQDVRDPAMTAHPAFANPEARKSLQLLAAYFARNGMKYLGRGRTAGLSIDDRPVLPAGAWHRLHSPRNHFAASSAK